MPANEEFLRNTVTKAQDHKAGRWLDKPKKEHLIVLQALEIANRAFDRVVKVSEVIQALSSKEVNILNKKYDSSLTLTISKILILLCKRGNVFKTSKVNKTNFYGIVDLPNLQVINTDDLRSLRNKILFLVEAAVVKQKRALQMGELVEFIQKQNNFSDVLPKLISQAIVSLKQTGELIKIPIRGNEKGFGVYLPSHFDPNEYSLTQPTTWLEFVLSTFNIIWKDHELKAQKFNSKPFPISTEEIRKKIIESGQFAYKLQDTRVLVSTLIQLAKTANRSLRKLQRPNQKSLFWLPLNIADSNVNMDDFYLRDSDRLEEAVRRAALRYGRPVKLNEVKEEVDFDSFLQPVSEIAYHKLLSNLAKERNYEKTKGNLIKKRIYRTGKYQGSSYYYFEDNPRAFAFIKYKLLEQKFYSMNASEELTRIRDCTIPSIAFGRSELMDAEIHSILNDLKQIKSESEIIGISDAEVGDLIKSIQKINRQIKNRERTRKSSFSHLPLVNKTKGKGLTSHELKEILTPLYHRINTNKSENNLQSLIGNTIKRIPNPSFKRINSKETQFAAEYLYDKSDALMFMAKEWGTAETRYHATVAYMELGNLRDPQFVIPALDSSDFNQRLCAVSCLAFLMDEKECNRLMISAVNDIDPGVRQSSLWAYGFVMGDKAIQFIKERAFEDKDLRVKKFAETLANSYTNAYFDLSRQ